MALPSWSHVAAVGIVAAVPLQHSRPPSSFPPSRSVSAVSEVPVRTLEIQSVPEVTIFVGPTQLPVTREEAMEKLLQIVETTEGRVQVVSGRDDEEEADRDAILRAIASDTSRGPTYFGTPAESADLARVPQLPSTHQTMAGPGFGRGPRAAPGTGSRRYVNGPASGSPASSVIGSGANAAAVAAARSNAAAAPAVAAVPAALAGSAPASAAARYNGATTVGGWREVAFDPSAPFGQRHTYEMTDATGAKHLTKASPLIVDLGGGLRTSEKSAYFDLIGEGRASRMADVASGVGILAYAGGKNGRLLFGDRTDLDGDGRPDGYADGFAALEAFVRRAMRDGVIDGRALADRRLDARDLARLWEAYGFGVKTRGFGSAPVAFKEAGVAALRLPTGTAAMERDFDRRGDDLERAAGATATFVDGHEAAYADLWLQLDAETSPAGGR